jgi:hypothetical protein
MVNAGWQYQESADTTTCENPANWDAVNTCSNIYDNDWDTYGIVNNPLTDSVVVSYNKPANALPTSLWLVKTGITMPDPENISIPINCFNQDPIQFKLESTNNIGVLYGHEYYCWDGSSCYDMGGAGEAKIFEEAMWWNIEPTNYKLVFHYKNKNIEIPTSKMTIKIEDNTITAEPTSKTIIRWLIKRLGRWV